MKNKTVHGYGAKPHGPDNQKVLNLISDRLRSNLSGGITEVSLQRGPLQTPVLNDRAV